MKKIFDYNDFLFENVNELRFRLSERLILLLKTIEHPIAVKLIDSYNNKDYKAITLIDYELWQNILSNFEFKRKINFNKI